MKEDALLKMEAEKKTIAFMIKLYCKKKHHEKTLCKECEEVKNYAFSKIDKCPFMETKTFCSSCKVHCYQKEYREKIRIIMKFSGPRMLLYRPRMAIAHIINTKKNKNL